MKYYILALLASSASADVSFQTGTWSHEVTWDITDNLGRVICKGGPYPRNYETFSSHCQLHGGDYTINCHDSHGDGYNGGFLKIANQEVCKDFRTGSRFTQVIHIPINESYDF